MERTGNWMQTYSGIKFWPLDPRMEEIHITDIAVALSRLCRFGGHTEKFYSVAEHSIIVSYNVPEFGLWGLLHDAAEAYIQDVVKPVKESLREYSLIESNLMYCIAHAFNLDPIVIPLDVKEVDHAVLYLEHKQAMKEGLVWWCDSETPIDGDIQFWNPDEACNRFMTRFWELTNIRNVPQKEGEK